MEEKNLEWFIREFAGLKGEYYSPEYKAAMAVADERERMLAFDDILEESGPEGYYTPEGWGAFCRVHAMLDALVEIGVLDEDVADGAHCRVNDIAG